MSFGRLSLDNIGSFHKRHENFFNVGKELLGIDPILLINIGLIFGAALTFVHYTWNYLYRYAQGVCLSSIHINEDDELYGYVMKWMAEYVIPTKSVRSVKATMPQKSSWEDEEDATKAIDQDFNVEKLISYRSIIGRRPIKLQPFEGGHLFRHKGSFLYFRHRVHRGTVIDPREKGYVKLECLGRSLKPIETLLKDMQTYTLEKSMSTTNIFRAQAGMREMIRWKKVVSRPSRAITTVILDKKIKQDLLEDINEYLHPRTRRWYADHGIPYRRGYLFSGAPGTGKTSLTSALAGVFGLDIYVLSLLDPALTESHLMQLMSDVPSRCIVLLEDVDTAGLEKRQLLKQARNRAKALTKPEDIAGELAGEKEKTNGPTSGISLSGLLNAIDGVSSHEGRILIMTTNSPKDLDKALIRPGRVDKHIEFLLPKKAEMEELFLSMYKKSSILPISQANGKSSGKTGGVATLSSEDKKLSEESKKDPDVELMELAKEFAGKLPEEALSLAAIQGFLLIHKRDPNKAVSYADSWVKELDKKVQEEEKPDQLVDVE